MLHARAQALGEECAVRACEQCVLDTEHSTGAEPGTERTVNTVRTDKLSQDTLALYTRLHGVKPIESNVAFEFSKTNPTPLVDVSRFMRPPLSRDSVSQTKNQRSSSASVSSGLELHRSRAKRFSLASAGQDSSAFEEIQAKESPRKVSLPGRMTTVRTKTKISVDDFALR